MINHGRQKLFETLRFDQLIRTFESITKGRKLVTKGRKSITNQMIEQIRGKLPQKCLNNRLKMMTTLIGSDANRRIKTLILIKGILWIFEKTPILKRRSFWKKIFQHFMHQSLTFSFSFIKREEEESEREKWRRESEWERGERVRVKLDEKMRNEIMIVEKMTRLAFCTFFFSLFFFPLLFSISLFSLPLIPNFLLFSLSLFFLFPTFFFSRFYLV